MSYVGNKRTKQIHRPECTRGKQISSRNRTSFNTLEEALYTDYEGCCYCLKQFDRNQGYYNDKVKPQNGELLADKIRRDKETLKNISVVYQEGVNPVAASSVSLRSHFTFPDGSLYDDDKKVEAKGSNLEYLKTVGTEKNVMSFAKDKAVLKVPVNCDLLPECFFSTKLMLPKNTANGKKLLMTGPVDLPVSVYLNVSGGKYTVSLKLVTEDKTKIEWSQSEEYDFMTEKWYSIIVVYVNNEIDVIVDTKKCISRKILFHKMGTGKNKYFTIGYDAAEPKNQFRGYISWFEYRSDVPQGYHLLISKAAKAGMGEIEYCYDTLDGAASLGTLVKKGTYKDGLYSEYKDGTIYWSSETGANCVRNPIRGEYNIYDGPSGPLGYPVSNVGIGRTAGVTVQLFQKGAIYWKATKDGSYGGGITGKAWEKYIAIEEDASGIGVPNPYRHDKNDPVHPFEVILERGFYRMPFYYIAGGTYYHSDIYFSDYTEPILIPTGPLHDYYWGDNIKKFGYPIHDEVVLRYLSNGNKMCYMVFENGELYWEYDRVANKMLHPVFLYGMNRQAYHDFGGYDKLGMPVLFPEKTNYCDCENGSLVYYNGKIHFIDEIEFRLVKAESEAIDDAPNSTAELCYTLTLQAKNDRERPDSQLVNIQKRYSRSKSDKNRTFPDDCCFRMKIRGASTIYINIKYEDYDIGYNDYLGRLEMTLDVENFWKLGYSQVAPGYPLEVIYSAPLSDYGSDASKNKYTTVRTTFTVKQMDGKQYMLNPRTFREESWWRFENYHNSGNLSQSFVASVFKDMSYTTNWLEKLFNPLDSIFYEAAKYAGIYGNCFGMCLAAIESYYQVDAFSMPVKKYQADSQDTQCPRESDKVKYPVGAYIQKCQLKQFSLSSIKHIVSEFCGQRIRSPKAVFYDVKMEIQKNRFSIITMLNIAHGFKGHAVLAYDYDDTTYGDIWRIYVADPNYSSQRQMNVGTVIDKTYMNWIEVDSKKNTYRYVKPDRSNYNAWVYDADYRTSSDKELNNYKLGTFDGLMFSTPYKDVSGTPVTPSWYILGLGIAALATLGLFGLALGGLTILGILGLIGDADCAEINCNGLPVKMDNNDIIPLVPTGDGGNVQIYLLTRPATIYSVKYKGRSSGNVKQILETPQEVFTVEAALAKGETAVVSVSKGDVKRPMLEVSGIKNKQIAMEIKNKRIGAYKENAERVELKTAASGKAALKLDLVTGKTGIQGAAKGNITLLKQVRSSWDTIEASKLTLTSKDSSEEIRVARPKMFALKDVLVERVDPETNNVKTREKYTFRKK